MNRWNAIAFYATAICIISAFYVLSALIIVAREGLQLEASSYLEAGLSHYGTYYEDNEAYRRYLCPVCDEDSKKMECSLTGKSDEQITALRERERDRNHANQVKTATGKAYKLFLDYLSTLIIGGIFFLIHWYILRRTLRQPLYVAPQTNVPT